MQSASTLVNCKYLEAEGKAEEDQQESGQGYCLVAR
jgi:hypothetical protein